MIKIWTRIAPGSENLNIVEEVIERSKDPKIKDRIVHNITKPSLTAFFPDKPNGTAILVIPGGAYQYIVIDKEGEDLKEWLNMLGITVFILKYRLPGEGHENAKDVPLQDAQRSVRFVRKNADKWGLNKNKIGVMGFSAGGHIASGLAVKYDKTIYEKTDDIDNENCRPDFLILLYPVITMLDPFTHKISKLKLLGEYPAKSLTEEYSNELLITSNTPQTFIVHAKDDKTVPAENSLFFYMGLKKVNAKVELHIFYQGGHGFSIRNAKGLPVAKWTLLCEEWMKSIGMI